MALPSYAWPACIPGNSLATAVVAKWEGELAPEHALGPDDVVPPDMIPGEVPGMQAGHA